jgi:hypothetical protein
MASTFARTAAALAVASLPLIAGATTAQASRPDGPRTNPCEKRENGPKPQSIAMRDQCDKPDPRPPTRDWRRDKDGKDGKYENQKKYREHKDYDKKYDPPKRHHDDDKWKKRHDDDKWKKDHHKRDHHKRDDHRKRDHRVKYDPYNEVRTATAKYFSVRAAELDGYRRASSGVLRGCITETPGKASPAMGFHWMNAALMDSKVELTKPEALVYEPNKDGKLDLVAVEYVVPKEAWDKAGNLHPPKLFGQEYSTVKIPGVPTFYALHAWVWKFNPDGIHAAYNPNVSCRYAGLLSK